MFKNLNIFRPIIAILLLFIPLYPKFPLFNVYGTYVAIRLDDIIIALTIFIWLIFQIKNHYPILKIKITKLFFVYFLAIFISFLNAYLIHQTEPVNILLLHLIRRFEYISVFFVSINSIKSIRDLNFAYIFLLLSTIFVCFYGYGQKYLKFPVISTMNSEFSKGQLLRMSVWTRISSTFAGHYDLAAYLSVVLIIIISVAIISHNKFVKVLSFIVWIPAYHIFTLTASRVSTFAFFGGICLTLFFLKKYWWILPISGLVIFSVINSTDLNQRLLATIPAIKYQLSNQNKNIVTPVPTLIPTPTISKITTNTTPIPIAATITPTIIRHQAEQYPEVDADVGVARSGEIRFNAEWPRAITAFKRNIFVGSGLGSITLATDNDYLRLLGENGLFGFISFFTIFLFFILKTLPLFFKKNPTIYDLSSIIFFGSLITTLANAIFIDVFEASKTAYLFWIMMGMYYSSLKFSNK